MFPLVSPTCIMQPFLHTCEVLYHYLCGFMKLFFSLSVWNGLPTPPLSASFPLKGHMEQAPNPDSSPRSLHFLVWVSQTEIRANMGAHLFWATHFWVSWFFFFSLCHGTDICSQWGINSWLKINFQVFQGLIRYLYFLIESCLTFSLRPYFLKSSLSPIVWEPEPLIHGPLGAIVDPHHSL